jgi:hypothetical protein
MSPRRHSFSYFGDRYILSPLIDADGRMRSDALDDQHATSLFEHVALQPDSTDSEGRQELYNLAQQLGVISDVHDARDLSSRFLFDHVRRELREGRALVVPLLDEFGAVSDESVWDERTLADAEAELSLFRKIFGAPLDAKGDQILAVRRNGRWFFRVEAYLRLRDQYIAPGPAYSDYLELCRSELNTNKNALRNVLEPPKNGRTRKEPDWALAQDVFYAWVRRGYQKALGNRVDIPALIKAGSSDELKAALDRVQVNTGMHFKKGGSNPRPMKKDGHYRLGTISDHAFGTAVDIEAEHNAQIDRTKWHFIEVYTGLMLDARTRTQLARSNPQELHRRLVAFNDAFVEKLRRAVAAQTAAGLSEKDATNAAIAADAQLKHIAGFVREWHGGFFNLPWALVKELHAAGFEWGAAFSTADLHHFQLPDKTPSATK